MDLGLCGLAYSAPAVSQRTQEQGAESTLDLTASTIECYCCILGGAHCCKRRIRSRYFISVVLYFFCQCSRPFCFMTSLRKRRQNVSAIA